MLSKQIPNHSISNKILGFPTGFTAKHSPLGKHTAPAFINIWFLCSLSHTFHYVICHSHSVSDHARVGQILIVMDILYTGKKRETLKYCRKLLHLHRNCKNSHINEKSIANENSLCNTIAQQDLHRMQHLWIWWIYSCFYTSC